MARLHQLKTARVVSEPAPLQFVLMNGCSQSKQIQQSRTISKPPTTRSHLHSADGGLYPGLMLQRKRAAQTRRPVSASNDRSFAKVETQERTTLFCTRWKYTWKAALSSRFHSSTVRFHGAKTLGIYRIHGIISTYAILVMARGVVRPEAHPIRSGSRGPRCSKGKVVDLLNTRIELRGRLWCVKTTGNTA